jgi:hypothetical protein
MAGTLIASWGGNLSGGVNAYVNYTDATSFITTAIPDPSAWTNATTATQIAAIIQATMDIDSKDYIGGRYYYDQFLKIPRQLNLSFPWNRTSVSSTVFSVEHARMQEHTKRACCWQALWIIRNGGFQLHAERIAQGVKATSESIGPIKEWIQYSGTSPAKLCQEAMTLLQPWMNQRRIYRA